MRSLAFALLHALPTARIPISILVFSLLLLSGGAVRAVPANNPITNGLVARTGASSPRPLSLTECLLIGPKENAA